MRREVGKEAQSSETFAEEILTIKLKHSHRCATEVVNMVYSEIGVKID